MKIKLDNFIIGHYYRSIPTNICDTYYIKFVDVWEDKYKTGKYICVNASVDGPSIQSFLDEYLCQCSYGCDKIMFEEIDEKQFKEALSVAYININKLVNKK